MEQPAQAIRTIQAIRYVTPLREGGSLPAIVEADDDGTYVLKFRGAALFFRHSWDNYHERSRSPFASIRDHILLRRAADLEKVDAESRARLTPEHLKSIVGLIPSGWLGDEPGFPSETEHRAAYTTY